MVKKTKKVSRRHRRKTRRTLRKVKGGNKFPMIAPSQAIEVSTAGESSDNLMAFTK